MLQDIPPPTTLREACPCVLETERLTLRSPTLADVKAIARLANDRRIAENTRRLPHPYLQEHAVEFVRSIAANRNELVFLIEQNFAPVGMAGISWSEPESPELGYWLGFEHWSQGFGTEAVRAVIDHDPGDQRCDDRQRERVSRDDEASVRAEVDHGFAAAARMSRNVRTRRRRSSLRMAERCSVTNNSVKATAMISSGTRMVG